MNFMKVLLAEHSETLPAAHRRNDQYFRAIWDLGRQSIRKADPFVTDKDVDVLANLTLLIHNSIA